MIWEAMKSPAWTKKHRCSLTNWWRRWRTAVIQAAFNVASVERPGAQDLAATSGQTATRPSTWDPEIPLRLFAGLPPPLTTVNNSISSKPHVERLLWMSQQQPQLAVSCLIPTCLKGHYESDSSVTFRHVSAQRLCGVCVGFRPPPGDLTARLWCDDKPLVGFFFFSFRRLPPLSLPLISSALISHPDFNTALQKPEEERSNCSLRNDWLRLSAITALKRQEISSTTTTTTVGLLLIIIIMKCC